jgi:hypothetical protein
MTVEQLTGLAAQLPLLVFFLWYTERMLKVFTGFIEKRDVEYLEAIRKISANLERLEDKFFEHDKWEREIKGRETANIEEIRSNTQPGNNPTSYRRRASDK